VTVPQNAASPNRRALIILVAGVGIALLVFLVTQVLGGDDDGDDISSSVTTTTRPFTGTTTTTTTAPGAQPTETFEVFSTKNPFLPLRTAAGAGGTTGGTTGGTSGGTSGGGTSGGTTGGTSGGGTTGGGTSGGTTGGTAGGTGSVEPRASQRVALLDVFTENGRVVANVRVNNTVHKVADGETFATSYRVLSLSASTGCGQFLFGDDQFRLCKGEETLK
jgi:hypothetical protein